MPVSIVSDKDPKFMTHFWKSFQRVMGTQLMMSTAFHPQTENQPERTIQTLEDILRACVLDLKGSWEEDLALVEFTYNNIYQTSIQMTPYEATIWNALSISGLLDGGGREILYWSKFG